MTLSASCKRVLLKRLGRWWVVLSLCLAGCGADEIPIEGTVTLDGQPLPRVQILFDQPEVPRGNSFAGRTDDEGRFALRPVDGPFEEIAGTYRVTLTTAVATRDATEHTPLPKERIPRKYRNGSLTFDLPPEGSTSADFELESK